MPHPITYISTGGVPEPLKDAVTREIEEVTPSDYTHEREKGPILTTFAVLQEEPALNTQLELAVENDLYTLVMPPIQEMNRSTTVSTIDETELTIRHKKTDKIHLGREVFPDTPDRELSVTTIGYFDSYPGRGFGKDRNDEPVLVEYREASTTGGILFTTIDLNKLAISGNEQHRQDLVAALIEYLDQAIQGTKEIDESGSVEDSSTEESDIEHSIPPRQYDAGLLTLYYYAHAEEAVELSNKLPETVLPKSIATGFTEEEWKQFIQAAERDGLIGESGLQSGAVSEAVDERNLRSFARRLEV